MKLNGLCKVVTGKIAVLLGVIFLFLPQYNSMAQSTGEWTPPKLISLASISINSAGFAAASGIVDVIQNKTGVKFRIEPAPSSIDRQEKVESHQVQFAVSAGGHAYSLQTGTADFNMKGWGPRPVRTVWSGGFMYAGFMARGDSGIKTVADLKGRKIAAYPGYVGINNNMEALLNYAGLT
ncbi:MAG: ABC transporter substrate-binding protein, partial [Desulfuromusa sp.]|nr:ABC transporter substrate-binding protein [Desulfuromusa sp.]